MSRGGSYGGGKSSLSYLFEQDETSTKHAQKVQAKEHEKSEEANRTRVSMSKPAGEKPQTTENTNTKVVQEGKPQKHISSDGAGRKYQDRSAIHFHTVSMILCIYVIPIMSRILCRRQHVFKFKLRAHETNCVVFCFRSGSFVDKG